MDCAGPLYYAAALCGHILPEWGGYSARDPESTEMLELFDRELERVEETDLGPARIALCAWRQGGSVPKHVAVMLDHHELLHVDALRRGAKIIPDTFLRDRLLAVYRIPGVDYGPPWQPFS